MIIDLILKTTRIKFFNNFIKPYFGSFLGQFFLPKNMALSHTNSCELLIALQNIEKTNDTISRKHADRRTMQGKGLFHRTVYCQMSKIPRPYMIPMKKFYHIKVLDKAIAYVLPKYFFKVVKVWKNKDIPPKSWR